MDPAASSDNVKTGIYTWCISDSDVWKKQPLIEPLAEDAVDFDFMQVQNMLHSFLPYCRRQEGITGNDVIIVEYDAFDVLTGLRGAMVYYCPTVLVAAKMVRTWGRNNNVPLEGMLSSESLLYYQVDDEPGFCMALCCHTSAMTGMSNVSSFLLRPEIFANVGNASVFEQYLRAVDLLGAQAISIEFPRREPKAKEEPLPCVVAVDLNTTNFARYIAKK